MENTEAQTKTPERKRFEIKPGEIEVTEFTGGATGPITIRVKHIPSSIVVTEKGYSRMRIKERLGAKLYEEFKKAGLVDIEEKQNELPS